MPPFCMRSNPGSSPAQAEGRIFSIMNINHAAQAGVTVREYKVMEQRDTEIEKGFDRITQEWLQQKKSGLLKFTLGSVGLEQPMDKRYFYASTAFIVFVPFLGKKGIWPMSQGTGRMRREV